MTGAELKLIALAASFGVVGFAWGRWWEHRQYIREREIMRQCASDFNAIFGRHL